MSTRAYAVNMGSLGTLQFNGFPRDRLNHKSKESCFVNSNEEVIS